MKIQLSRTEQFEEIKNVTIEINGCRYRLSETVDKRLKINKVSIKGDDDYIRVHPTSGNEIDVS